MPGIAIGLKEHREVSHALRADGMGLDIRVGHSSDCTSWTRRYIRTSAVDSGAAMRPDGRTCIARRAHRSGSALLDDQVVPLHGPDRRSGARRAVRCPQSGQRAPSPLVGQSLSSTQRVTARW